MKGGDERQPGNAKVTEDEERRGGWRVMGCKGKVGMKVCEEKAVPGIETERGSEKRKC